jgi:hypothetical protein
MGYTVSAITASRKLKNRDEVDSVIMHFLTLYPNILLYHKVRKCHFASASTVCEAEASAEAPQVRRLAKHFLAV